MSWRHSLVPIAWLSRPVRLLDGGHGPWVVGVTQDALLGQELLRTWENEARKRGIEGGT
jgi:hypothetical protein